MGRTTSYSIHDGVTGGVHISLAPIGGNRSVSIPKEARKLIPWLQGDRLRKSVLFYIGEPGFAYGVLESAHFPELEARIKDDPDFAEAASTTIFRGRFQPEDKLFLPPPVIAHVLSDLRIEGALYVVARQDRVELQSEAYRLSQVSAANTRIEDMGGFPIQD